MALSFSSDFKSQATGVSNSITSNALSVAAGDLLTVTAIAADSTQISAFTIVNNNTAISWTSVGSIAASSECGIFTFKGFATGTPPTTVTVTASAGTTLIGSKAINSIVHTGAHATTPVPAGNVFTASSQTSVTRAITPSSSGSCLWLVAADWGATNSYAAGANCTAQHNVNQSGEQTSLVLRPTTQPRLDALAFSLAETHTGSQVSYVAFEVQAAAANTSIAWVSA